MQGRLGAVQYRMISDGQTHKAEVRWSEADNHRNQFTNIPSIHVALAASWSAVFVDIGHINAMGLAKRHLITSNEVLNS